MSKFLPFGAVFSEQIQQIRRRQNVEKNIDTTAIRAQFDTEEMSKLKNSSPDKLASFSALTELGLTERHTLALLGRWYGERLLLEKARAKDAADAAKLEADKIEAAE